MNRILGPLVRTIQDTEQAKKLLIAVGLGSYTNDTEVAFWEILSRIDDEGELLGNAIVITAQVYDGPGLIDYLTELQIMRGSQVFNRLQDGIFKTEYVEDESLGTFKFFIYSVDY